MYFLVSDSALPHSHPCAVQLVLAGRSELTCIFLPLLLPDLGSQITYRRRTTSLSVWKHLRDTHSDTPSGVGTVPLPRRVDRVFPVREGLGAQGGEDNAGVGGAVARTGRGGQAGRDIFPGERGVVNVMASHGFGRLDWDRGKKEGCMRGVAKRGEY
jgi:hypothetical protein